MPIVFSSIMLGCLVVIAICCIVFPILFLASFRRFRKDMIEVLKEKKLVEEKDEI